MAGGYLLCGTYEAKHKAQKRPASCSQMSPASCWGFSFYKLAGTENQTYYGVTSQGLHVLQDLISTKSENHTCIEPKLPPQPIPTSSPSLTNLLMINVLDLNSDSMINVRKNMSMLYAWAILEGVFFFFLLSIQVQDKFPSCHFIPVSVNLVTHASFSYKAAACHPQTSCSD